MPRFPQKPNVAGMVTHIRRGAKTHLYITQWREHRGLSMERLAGLLDVDRTTIWRWETGARRPKPEQQAAIANALGIEPADLWRLPDTRPSIDAIIKDAPDDIFDAVADMARRLASRRAG